MAVVRYARRPAVRCSRAPPSESVPVGTSRQTVEAQHVLLDCSGLDRHSAAMRVVRVALGGALVEFAVRRLEVTGRDQLSLAVGSGIPQMQNEVRVGNGYSATAIDDIAAAKPDLVTVYRPASQPIPRGGPRERPQWSESLAA